MAEQVDIAVDLGAVPQEVAGVGVAPAVRGGSADCPAADHRSRTSRYVCSTLVQFSWRARSSEAAETMQGLPLVPFREHPGLHPEVLSRESACRR